MKIFNALAISTLVLLVLILGAGERGYTESNPEPRIPPVTPLSLILPTPALPGSPTVQPESEASVEGTLEITARLSHGAIGEASFDELYAEIRLVSGDILPDDRPALNVALVLDRSGSMRGEPMTQAREAAKTFVESLGEKDQVALITFDHTSWVEVPTVTTDRAGKQKLLAKIEGLRASGATNISAGLEEGLRQVKQNREPNTVDRVIIMTDGFPNHGLTSTETLSTLARSVRNQGVTVSTLGFGTGYNAQMLVAMAEEGAGNHRYIDGAQEMAQAFADELEDLQNTVASGIELYLRPARGVEILDVYGFSRQREGVEERITLGDLRAQGRRSVIARLRVAGSDAPDVQELLKVRARYMDRIEQGQAQAQSALQVQRVRDQSDVLASVDTEVMTRVEEVLAMRSIQQVLELYERGQVEQAQNHLRQERRRSQQARAAFGISESAPTRQVDTMLDHVEAEMRAAPRPSSRKARRMINSVSAVSVSKTQGF